MSLLLSNALKKEKELYFKGRTLRKLHQTGKYVNKVRDAARPALAAGKRVSKSGKIYWETRKNRSDATGDSI